MNALAEAPADTDSTVHAQPKHAGVPRPWPSVESPTVRTDRVRQPLPDGSWLTVVNGTREAHRAHPRRHGELDRTAESVDMAEALAALRPEHREAIVEVFYRGSSTTQAATALGIPAGTVKSRMYYGLKALRLVLQERGITP